MMKDSTFEYCLLEGSIKIQTGLKIGAGDGLIQIGGIDLAVVKHPYTLEPYIPGSSLKGRMRALLELWYGLSLKSEGNVFSLSEIEKKLDFYKEQVLYNDALNIVKLFGGSAADNTDKLKQEMIGAARASFWDCSLCQDWSKERKDNFQPYTEEKFENSINRITSKAKHPRKIERVPEGAKFDFKLTLKHNRENDDLDGFKQKLALGFALIELEGLGGSTSRGYGRVEFEINGAFDDLKKEQKGVILKQEKHEGGPDSQGN